MKISEILWKAANEHLSPGGNYGVEYSCLAVRGVIATTMYDWLSYREFSKTPAARFLRELGCPIGSEHAFSKALFRSSIDRQQARYAWLMFASMYAAELEAKGEL